jgi:hypothetical protein
MLLLMIDENKVREKLAAATPAYVATACNLEMPLPKYYPELEIKVSGAAMTLPPDAERARNRLIELRQRLIESGSKELSGEELQRTFDETCGR